MTWPGVSPSVPAMMKWSRSISLPWRMKNTSTHDSPTEGATAMTSMFSLDRCRTF